MTNDSQDFDGPTAEDEGLAAKALRADDLSVDDTDRDPFEELASEFSDRHRRGEMPSVEEYAEKYPELADEIRELFPTIAAMEQLKERKAPAKPAQGGLEIEQLGDFRILGEIGRGGMGVVYEAEQVSLGRHVAVKVLPRQALLEERHLRRFEREAQTAAKLHHTNIVPVFGVGQQDGFHYIVMQFIPGVGLDEILVALRSLVLTDDSARFHMDSSSRASHANHNARALLDGDFTKRAASAMSSFVKDTKRPGSGTQPLGSNVDTMAATQALSDSLRTGSSSISLSGAEPAESDSLDTDQSQRLTELDREYYQSVAKIGQQVADALAYAHEQGTLHRDIKPGNLLLDGNGTVWVADFGLAKLAEQDNVSRTGDIVGTLSYMPPESFSGDTDGRGDIYALGLTLYEMLALRPAYYGRDRGKLVRQITEGDLPRLGKLNPAVPRDLETIVLKAIEQQPEDRYATARELEEDLQSFLTDMPIKARRMSIPEQFTRWCRKNKMVASLSAAVVSLLLLSSIVFGFLSYEAKRQANLASANEQRAKEQEQIAITAEQAARESARLAKEQEQIAITAEQAARKSARLAKQQEQIAIAAGQEAIAAEQQARQTARKAFAVLRRIFNGLAPDRLPPTADRATPEEDTLTSNALIEAQSTEASEDGSEETTATVAVAPVTPETAAQLEVLLDSIVNLTEDVADDAEFAPIFADLTIRVGKLHRMLGNYDEALDYFDRGIEMYKAIEEKKTSDIVGLASSYNEKGDLLAMTSNRRFDSNASFRSALKLYDSLPADLPRADFEHARTLFLMSMEYDRRGPGPGFGGRSRRGGPRGPDGRGPGNGRGPGDGRGPRDRGPMAGPPPSRDDGPPMGPPPGFGNGPPGDREQRGFRGWGSRSRDRLNNLNQAIELLEPLVVSETNPEYVYLLARCHTSAARSNFGRASEQKQSIRNAIELLEQLVRDQPDVLDYKFEYAIAQFFGLGMDRETDEEERVRVLENVVNIMSEITAKSPAISHYALVGARVKHAYAESLHRLAGVMEGEADDSSVEMRSRAEVAFRDAVTAMDDVKQRFPQAIKNDAQRFPDGGMIRALGQQIKRNLALANATRLMGEGKRDEAVQLLTPIRDDLVAEVTRDANELMSFGRPGPDSNRFSGAIMLCRVEKQLSGPDAARDMVDKLVRSARESLANAPKGFQSVGSEFLHAKLLGAIGAEEEANTKLQQILEMIEPRVPQSSDEMRGRSREADNRRILAVLYFKVLEELGEHEKLRDYRDKMRFSSRGDRGGHSRGGRPPAPDDD